jgi:hypothetical protein
MRSADWVTDWTAEESWFDSWYDQEIFFRLQSVQTGSGAYLACCSVCPGGKVSGTDHSSRSGALRSVKLYRQSPYALMA